MLKASRFIISAFFAYVLLCGFVSCGRDGDVSGDPSDPDDMMLEVGFRIATRGTTDDEYEIGEDYESYIDIEGGDYRIYFFDTNNKLIDRFDPSGFVSKEGSGYRHYSVLGKAPDRLAGYSKFKMVVLANWNRQYDDNNIKVGVTSIDDICGADWATFDAKQNMKLGSANLIPFFGVHEYSNVDFKPGVATILSESVTLLRAMAKVEVILETDSYYDLSFSEVKISRYNNKGFCAPSGVYSQNDYGQGNDWDYDYLRSLHLVNNMNDNDEKSLPFYKLKRWDDGGKRFEKWIVYLPEYMNEGVGDLYSGIKAKFNIQLAEDNPHTIYFCKYTSEGEPDNSDTNRLNIERNNIYRFYVKCNSYNYSLLLTVSDWEGLYKNNFEYGNGQFTTPPAPWEDKIDINVEF